MTKQRRHTRTSKYGKRFGAGQGFPKPKIKRNPRYYIENEDAEEFVVEITKGSRDGKIRIYKDSSDYNKWKEENIEGDLAGDKTYMSYLKPNDVLSWLKGDFDSVEVVEVDGVEVE